MVLGTAWRAGDNTGAMEDTTRCTANAQSFDATALWTPKNPVPIERALVTNQNTAMESRRILLPSVPHLYSGAK